MNNQEENIPTEITEFEKVLLSYKSKVDSLRTGTETKEYKDIKNIAGILYQKGANLAALMEGLINKNIITDFRESLGDIYDLADNYYHDRLERMKRIESVEKIYWTVRPIIIGEYLRNKQKIVKLNLDEGVDADARDYLKEAGRSLNANAPRASVVMSGAALEKILRKIHDLRIGKSENIKLWKVMENLENENILKDEKERVILQICKFFRNFSAHPSEFVISTDLAKIIFQSAETLVNSETNKPITPR